MKQYQIIKYVYANSLRQAIEKERDGIIISTYCSDDITLEDFETELENKRLLSKNIYEKGRKS